MSTATTITQPIRDEHQELQPHIEMLTAAADSIGETSMEHLRAEVGGAYDFLVEHLIPHARAEDAALYPVVGRVMGSAAATATMSRDHVEVGRLTDELHWLLQRVAADTELTASDAAALRRVLYGLAAIVKLHFAKEEEIYLPLLDARLSAVEAQELFTALEQAGHSAA
jgi:iron-sulfur cluster repair protein YtfE (RIC family)